MKPLFKKISYTFLFLVSGTLLNYLLQLVLAKFMGTNLFGIYTYIYTWLMVVLLVPKMGFDTASLKFIPEYLSQKQWPALRGILTVSTGLSAAVAIFLTIVVLIVTKSLPGLFSADTRIMIVLFGVSLTPMVLLRIYQAQLQAFQNPVQSMFAASLLVPIIHLLFVSSWYCFGGRVTGVIAVIGLIVSSSSACLYLRYNLEGKIRGIYTGHIAKIHGRHWFSTIWPLSLLSSLTFLLQRIDILVLGLFEKPGTIAIYSISSLIATTITFALQANNTVVVPQISSFYHGGEKTQMQKKLRESMLYLTCFTIPFYILLLGAAKMLLSWFGEEYQQGIYVVIILATAQLFNSFCGPVGFIMNVTKYQRKAVTIIFSALLLCVLLNLVFIPLAGMEGAAAATAATIVLWNFWMLLFIRRHLNIDPSIRNLFGKKHAP